MPYIYLWGPLSIFVVFTALEYSLTKREMQSKEFINAQQFNSNYNKITKFILNIVRLLNHCFSQLTQKSCLVSHNVRKRNDLKISLDSDQHSKINLCILF